MGDFLSRNKTGWLEGFLGILLQQGRIPSHIGIILDGNRRYAKSQNFLSVTDGHRAGGKRINDVIRMCVELGVRRLSLYLFSKENFNRGRKEVLGIFSILLEYLQQCLAARDELKKDGIRIDVMGNWTELPRSLRECLETLMRQTEHNSNLVISFALVYSGRSEICQGVSHTVEKIRKSAICAENVTFEEIQSHFQPSSCQPLDLLIRTSGECRFSDFMMWQSTHAYIHFEPVTWPEFTYWHFFLALFHYQQHCTYNQQNHGDNTKINNF